MTTRYVQRFRCDCGAVYDEDKLPSWPGPQGARWFYCADCFEPWGIEFENICDDPGCSRLAGCGWPSDEGYRRTCFEHWKRAN